MRRLSPPFIDDLRHGFLRELVATVQADKDLNLEIRDGYLNIYYKGNALLKLIERKQHVYRIETHKKFRGEQNFPDLIDQETIARFLVHIPLIKANIVQYGSTSLELEYEQLIIRANNREARNTNEYFIVDRQYVIGAGRFDLTGVFWPREHRRVGQRVQPCLMEVKFALNSDIKEVHQQLQRYYDAIHSKAEQIAEEIEGIFQQKLDLGLYEQDEARIDAMKTLTVARTIEDFQFVLILVDYNPSSLLLDIGRLKELPFAKQIKLFRTGFAMWERNLTLM